MRFVEHYYDLIVLESAAATSDVVTTAADWMALTVNFVDPLALDFVATSFPEFVAAGCQRSLTTIVVFGVPLRFQSPSSCDLPVSAVPVVAFE